MTAELTQIRGRARRWQFSAGVLWVVLFPPLQHRNRVVAVAAVGLMIGAAATLAAAREVPSLSVFVVVLGLLLCGYGTMAASRSPRPRRTTPHMIVSLVALTAMAATITTVVRIAVAHPAATVDRTHVFSILLAVALTGYLAFALTPPLGDHANAVLWWALAAALTSSAAWALTTSAANLGVIPFLPPAAVIATLAAAVGASVTTRSSPAGARAGLLATALSAPLYVTINLTALLQLHHYTLTDPYDIAAYPHSGYPDVASYLLSDTLGGEVIAGLVLSPIALAALALLGAAAGTRIRRPATGA
jgi:hypothetical protein